MKDSTLLSTMPSFSNLSLFSVCRTCTAIFLLIFRAKLVSSIALLRCFVRISICDLNEMFEVSTGRVCWLDTIGYYLSNIQSFKIGALQKTCHWSAVKKGGFQISKMHGTHRNNFCSSLPQQNKVDRRLPSNYLNVGWKTMVASLSMSHGREGYCATVERRNP